MLRSPYHPRSPTAAGVVFPVPSAYFLLPASVLQGQHAGAGAGAIETVLLRNSARPLMTAAQRTKRMAMSTLRQARRIVVLVVGLTVLAIGIAMVVLPGPAFIVIPVGLAILATEFVWAQRLLDNMKERGRQFVGKSKSNDGNQ